MEEVKTEIGQMKSAADSTHYQLIGEYRQKGANAVESDGSNQVLMATKASASSSAKTFTICEVKVVLMIWLRTRTPTIYCNNC